MSMSHVILYLCKMRARHRYFFKQLYSNFRADIYCRCYGFELLFNVFNTGGYDRDASGQDERMNWDGGWRVCQNAGSERFQGFRNVMSLLLVVLSNIRPGAYGNVCI